MCCSAIITKGVQISATASFHVCWSPWYFGKSSFARYFPRMYTYQLDIGEPDVLLAFFTMEQQNSIFWFECMRKLLRYGQATDAVLGCFQVRKIARSRMGRSSSVEKLLNFPLVSLKYDEVFIVWKCYWYHRVVLQWFSRSVTLA